jgi:hypothetical protein
MKLSFIGKMVYFIMNLILLAYFVGNSGIVFRKSAWEAIGGHPLENAGYDMTFIESLNAYGGRTLLNLLNQKLVGYIDGI